MKDKPQLVIEDYEYLIHAQIRRLKAFCKGALGEDDLMQVGRMALWDSWHKFDPTRGVQFQTFANYRVKARLWLAVMANGYPVKYPREAFREMTVEHRSVPFGSSLDATPGNGSGSDTPMRERIADESVVNPDDYADIRALARVMNDVLSYTLDERELDIVTQYGVYGYDVPMAELGRKHRISRERVRQIYERCIDRLRKSDRAEVLLEWMVAS
jgi:RNA polymerase sigma factor for flagellar operon FliA